MLLHLYCGRVPRFSVSMIHVDIVRCNAWVVIPSGYSRGQCLLTYRKLERRMVKSYPSSNWHCAWNGVINILLSHNSRVPSVGNAVWFPDLERGEWKGRLMGGAWTRVG